MNITKSFFLSVSVRFIVLLGQAKIFCASSGLPKNLGRSVRIKICLEEIIWLSTDPRKLMNDIDAWPQAPMNWSPEG